MTPVGFSTAFLDNRHTLSLIAVALVTDEETYYAIDRGMPMRAIKADEFLMGNVWPHLPLTRTGEIDLNDESVKPRERIAAEVKEFLAHRKDWQLVGAHQASDIVNFYQLYEKGQEPEGFIWRGYELMQEADRQGTILPPQANALHHQLFRAQWHLKSYEWLQERDELLTGAVVFA